MYDHQYVAIKKEHKSGTRVIFEHVLLRKDGWIIAYYTIDTEYLAGSGRRQDRVAFVKMQGCEVLWDKCTHDYT